MRILRLWRGLLLHDAIKKGTYGGPTHTSQHHINKWFNTLNKCTRNEYTDKKKRKNPHSSLRASVVLTNFCIILPFNLINSSISNLCFYLFWIISLHIFFIHKYICLYTLCIISQLFANWLISIIGVDWLFIRHSVGLICKLMPTINRPSNENQPFSLNSCISTLQQSKVKCFLVISPSKPTIIRP